jgi:elongation factor Ts
MAFTAKDVQALRERTNCGMMDCKKALTEANGDMEKAIEFLREKGLAAASKKAGRIAADGIVDAYVTEDAKVGVLIEVNSETDFVAKNSEFQTFVKNCAKTVAMQNPQDVNALLKMKLYGNDATVEEELTDKILTIGENLKIRRFTHYEGDVMTYIHGGGRIGVMVKFQTDADTKSEAFIEFAKNICMQIAAISPIYLSEEQVPAEVVDKEKEILTTQAINEGKPQAIAEKMVAGRIKKFYKDVCLLEQAYVKDGEISVREYAIQFAKEIGKNVSIVEFVRYEKGEGLEKREDNFADEVASLVK